MNKFSQLLLLVTCMASLIQPIQAQPTFVSQVKLRDVVQDPALRQIVAYAFRLYNNTIIQATDAEEKRQALENLAHVRRLVSHVVTHAAELRDLTVDPQILITAIVLSDLGKYGKPRQELAAQYGWAVDDVRTFLMHEYYGTRLIESWNHDPTRVKLSLQQQMSLINAIYGHNGPAVIGSWWGQKWQEHFDEPYPMPVTLEAYVHTLLDRIDQATLMLRTKSASGKTTAVGGLLKILIDLTSGPTPLSLAAAVKEVFYELQKQTDSQIYALREFADTCLRTNPYSRQIDVWRSQFIQMLIKKMRLGYAFAAAIHIQGQQVFINKNLVADREDFLAQLPTTLADLEVQATTVQTEAENRLRNNMLAQLGKLFGQLVHYSQLVLDSRAPDLTQAWEAQVLPLMSLIVQAVGSIAQKSTTYLIPFCHGAYLNQDFTNSLHLVARLFVSQIAKSDVLKAQSVAAALLQQPGGVLSPTRRLAPISWEVAIKALYQIQDITLSHKSAAIFQLATTVNPNAFVGNPGIREALIGTQQVLTAMPTTHPWQPQLALVQAQISTLLP